MMHAYFHAASGFGIIKKLVVTMDDFCARVARGVAGGMKNSNHRELLLHVVISNHLYSNKES